MTLGGPSRPSSLRIRSPRKAREWIDRAAVAIADAPHEWPGIVNNLRTALGRPPLPPGPPNPADFQFAQTEVDGRPAAYPVKRLKAVAGGGMNAVLRACDLFADRDLAFRRQLPPESALAMELRQRREALLRERLMTLPRHPVIPRYWATARIDGEQCDIFDFAPGVSLSRFVVEQGMTYGQLLDFAVHAARGLQYLHRHDLIHGDVKPENFCVQVRPATSEGEVSVRVHLIDFDIVSTPTEQLRQYALGDALEGTLPYMPPENFAQYVPEESDEARGMVFSKDVYALGMSLVRVINGKFPKSFYTSINSLLDKKTAGEEVLLDLPDSLPPTLQVLIAGMCSNDWKERPPLSVVIRTARGLKEAASLEERQAQIVKPSPEGMPPQPKSQDLQHVGPYRVMNPSFGRRPTQDGQQLPIAELQDPFGRKLVGVPFAFPEREAETAFYDERCELLKDLNAVRLKHSELFPGSFRDLVREKKDERFLVWIIRPLLEGAKDLRRFLVDDFPNADAGERVAILRRAAEGLAVLQEAGYHLARLTPELIFFVPQPGDAGGTITRAALTRPIRRLFDIPTAGEGRRWRQELMGTAGAQRGPNPSPDPTVADMMEIAEEMGLDKDLSSDEWTYLAQIEDVETWRNRVDILLWLEMQRTGRPRTPSGMFRTP